MKNTEIKIVIYRTLSNGSLEIDIVPQKKNYLMRDPNRWERIAVKVIKFTEKEGL
jgi:hypothetical protein